MGAGMWRELVGSWTYTSGVNGTFTMPRGGIILSIRCEGPGSITIFNRPTYTFTAGFNINFHHTLVEAQQIEGLDIVITGTTSYWIEYLKPAGT